MAVHIFRAGIRALPAAALFLAGLSLSGCGLFGGGDRASVKPLPSAAYADPNALPPPAIVAPETANKQQEAGASLQVNKYLWRGALETLGFMPFASTDPFGGVIVTDWYSPPGSQGERFKATAYILGRELRTDGLKVTIFRQTRDGGEWQDAAVNPATATDIEGKILARARELRARGVK